MTRLLRFLGSRQRKRGNVALGDVHCWHGQRLRFCQAIDHRVCPKSRHMLKSKMYSEFKSFALRLHTILVRCTCSNSHSFRLCPPLVAWAGILDFKTIVCTQLRSCRPRHSCPRTCARGKVAAQSIRDYMGEPFQIDVHLGQLSTHLRKQLTILTVRPLQSRSPLLYVADKLRLNGDSSERAHLHGRCIVRRHDEEVTNCSRSEHIQSRPSHLARTLSVPPQTSRS